MRVVLSLCLVCVIPGPANSQVAFPSNTAMLDCSGLPCAEAELANGKRLRLLIDTGNVNSVVDTAVAKELGLSTIPVTGSDGKVVTGYSRGVLPNVLLGAGSLGDVKVLVMDLASYIKADKMPACDGTLAYTAFKDRLLQLDYPKRQVRVSRPLTSAVACATFCGNLSTPSFGKRGPPILVATGFSINNHEVTAQIDTLFNGTLLIYPTSVDKLGLTRAAQTEKKRFFNYTDDGVDMLEGRAENEAFGKSVLARNTTVYFATPAVHLPDGMFDATVGQELLEHSVVSLDLHNMKMWMTE